MYPATTPAGAPALARPITPPAPAAGGTIIRVSKDVSHPYARVDNSVFTTRNLSPEARWALGYLLSKPDNWELRMSDLQHQAGCGRDKARRLVRELEAAGHLVRCRTHRTDGRWIWESVIYEVPPFPAMVPVAATPTPAPSPEKPSMVAPPAATPPPALPAINQDRIVATTELTKTDLGDSNQPAIVEKDAPTPRYSPYIAAVVLDHSRELGDGYHAPANITQALRLAQASGLPEQTFVDQLHTARQRVRTYQGKQGQGQLNNKMAYYFVVLRDLCGLGDTPKCRN